MFNLQAFEALSRRCDLRVMAPVPWYERRRRPWELLSAPSLKRGAMRIDYPTFWYLPRVAAGLQESALECSLLPQVANLRRTFSFDAVLAAWAYPDGAAAVRIASRFGASCVTMVLGSDLNALAARPELRGRIVSALSRTDRVITVSGALAQRAQALGIPVDRLRVQHNGVDGDRFRPRESAPLRTKLGFEAHQRLVVYLGNLVPEKGPDLLIRALAHLRPDERPQAALVGDGPYEPELRRLAAELGVTDWVRFCGRRPFAEIPDWLAASDLLCLPSRREGCPNVVLESLASGRPVAACAVGGVPEILSNSSGRLVAPEDPAALGIAMHEILSQTWDPAELRATVPFLSWDDFAGSLYRELEAVTPVRQSPAMALA